MEANINVVEILKDKSRGTKLYSSAFGQMTYEGIAYDENGKEIWLLTENEVDTLYLSDGKYREGGEITLFPSKEMHDWSKFAWKRGDVLVSNDGDSHIIFKGFSTEDYSMFEGKHWISISKKRYISCLNVQNVQDYHIENDKDAVQTYINTIEERFCGKLNFKTLDIEKDPASFKDGDIVVTDPSRCHSKCIFILKGGLNACESHASSYVFYNIDNNHISFDIVDRTIRDRNIHLATVEEELELFDALTKEGKYWDAEKKQIVDLSKKYKFKPFDKVLGRNTEDGIWEAEIFSHYEEGSQYPFRCVGYSRKYCIPYNENTKYLLGTTNNLNKYEG